MRECSSKKELKVKVAQNDPLTQLAKKIDQVDSIIKQGHGVVLHVQEEVYQSTLTFRRRVAGYQQ